MKHQPPKVEDYNSEDATPKPPSTEKRKRGSKNYKQSQEQTPELEAQQPPSKAAKSEAPAENGDAEEPEPEDNVEDGEDGEDGQKDEDYDEGDDGQGEEYEGQEGEYEGQGEEDEEEDQQNSTVDEPKAHKVIEEFGRAPLDRTPLANKTLTAAPEMILAMAIDAMLKSRPISHDLTQRAVSHVIEVGYHEIQNLGKSSWEERAMVLKDGGYNRYREQGATNLGNLVDLVDGKYGMLKSIA